MQYHNLHLANTENMVMSNHWVEKTLLQFLIAVYSWKTSPRTPDNDLVMLRVFLVLFFQIMRPDMLTVDCMIKRAKLKPKT